MSDLRYFIYNTYINTYGRNLLIINKNRYLALEEKKEILIEELFEDKPEDYVKAITQRYH